MRLKIDVHHFHSFPNVEELIMAISAQVQTLVDTVQSQRNIVQALVDADKVRDQQLLDLQNKVQELIDAGGTSAEDGAAIQQAITEIQETNATLTQVTAENTPFQGAKPPASDPNGPVGTGEGLAGGNPVSTSAPAGAPAGEVDPVTGDPVDPTKPAA